MDIIYFLLSRGSQWLKGEAWDMPHQLWYEDEGGFLLGLIILVVVSMVVAVIYYQLFSRWFRNTPLSRLNWLAFAVFNAGAILSRTRIGHSR